MLREIVLTAQAKFLLSPILVGCVKKIRTPGGVIMLWTILVSLLALWLIGMISGVGGVLVHLLLAVALAVFIINFVSARVAA